MRVIRISGAVLSTAAIMMIGMPASVAVPITPCSTEIGKAGVARLRKACMDVSPATHPPCGTRNACALIEDEIARGCAILGDAAAAKIAACGPAPTSAAAAAAVIRRFYRAIDERDYATAYDMMRPDAGRTESLAAFQAGFAATGSTRVETGTSTIEGAAGSAYATVAVTVDATLDNGTHQSFGGTYTLRRIEPQGPYPTDAMRWHIVASDLHRTSR